MKVTRLEIEGLALIELKVHGDARGFFTERFQRARFADAGLPTDFVQDNHSRSAPGVLRGLHYQHTPAQGKLIGVVRGRIWDVVVDIRPHSATCGQHFACELSDLNGRLLWSDAALGIKWPIEHPVISSRDQRLPSFADYRRNPVEWQKER